MKFKTENYRETQDMLGWLTCVVNEVKYHAPQADTPTLFKAREIAQKNGEMGKLKILTRELFFRLEPGDTVYTIPFDRYSPAFPNTEYKTVKVEGWSPSGKAVRLKGLCGLWGWQYIYIPCVQTLRGFDGDEN